MSMMPANDPYVWLLGVAAVLRGIAELVKVVRSPAPQRSRRSRRDRGA
jgi:hypothetical protein